MQLTSLDLHVADELGESIDLTGYPTAEEIMAADMTHKPEVLAFVRQWKATTWKTWRKTNKAYALRVLLDTIASCFYHKPLKNIVICADGPGFAFYMPESESIILGSDSVITGLHELAHHIFDDCDEHKACAWSIHLFRKTFPRSFNKLEFVNGSHILAKKSSKTEQPEKLQDSDTLLQVPEQDPLPV